MLFVWAQREPELAAELASHGDGLQWVQFRRVGVATSILRLFAPFPRVQLTSASGASAIALAEHVLAVLLGLYKRLPTLYGISSGANGSVSSASPSCAGRPPASSASATSAAASREYSEGHSPSVARCSGDVAVEAPSAVGTRTFWV